jgi:hypothetical protein
MEHIRAAVGACLLAVAIGGATVSAQVPTVVSEATIADEVATRIVLESAFGKRLRTTGIDILVDHPGLTLEQRVGWGLVMQQATGSQELIDSVLRLAVLMAKASSDRPIVEAHVKAMAIRNSVLTDEFVKSSNGIELLLLKSMTAEGASTVVRIGAMSGVMPIVEAWRTIRATAEEVLAASPDIPKSFDSARAIKAQVASDELKQARERVAALIGQAK